ncbi:MAG: hypothetical protein GY788_07430 [bacterium]|nr:hypothetical protein [bacterium]
MSDEIPGDDMAEKDTGIGDRVDPVVRAITFNSPDTHPKYANETAYILIVTILPASEEEHMIPGRWDHENQQWWIPSEGDIAANTELYEDGLILPPELYEPLSSNGFFSLKGWAPVWGGSDSH